MLLCVIASAFATVTAHTSTPPPQSEVKARLQGYVLHTKAKDASFAMQPVMESYSVDHTSRSLTLRVSDAFAAQAFTAKTVDYYYRRLAKALPKPYSRYRLRIETAGMPIEMLVDGARIPYGESAPAAWGDIEYEGRPWVDNVSKPLLPSHGLYDRHLALWASHGMFYDWKKGKWRWQRPNLFCTTEDLFTQTIVVPYLIPMLENAGAVVYTPRERDWQPREVIVDNDRPNVNGVYVEADGKHAWTNTQQRGFAWHAGTYRDGENPFVAGSARAVRTIKRGDESWISYQPSLPEGGRYAVYVSYQTVQGSVDDATYIVMHRGQRTEFKVNQRMGGGTWVYLGTFDFDKGCSEHNRVVLTNLSASHGVVTADAVRFGGGMGNIQRNGTPSGMPRCLEGARYSVQWAGAPVSVYNTKDGNDDYGDDINCRSNMLNWLAGGSVYVPTLEGNNVPIELSLAIHSDAGHQHGDSIVGSLAVCTTAHNDGRLASGISRLVSHDFADTLLTGLTRDLRSVYGKWTRRYLWDRNYSETRKPEVPSAIIETLSHQNFADMRRGLDPNFRFTVARSLYKSILRQVSGSHSRPCVVQPLPVEAFRVERASDETLRLSWRPVKDPSEPTASPTSYMLYVAEDGGNFDNGTPIYATTHLMQVRKGVVYRFRVTAVNRGGESFPSETLAACLSVSPDAADVLVIDGFQRLASPQVVNTGGRMGFDMDADMGVSYGLCAGWNGRQQVFSAARAGGEGPNALGYCGDELAGHFVMGNQRDVAVCHVADIASSGAYNVVSATLQAVESGAVTVNRYSVVDIAFGLQRDDGYSLLSYKTFRQQLRTQIESYVSRGGRLLVSGAYVATDMSLDAERKFLAKVLKTGSAGACTTRSNSRVEGMGVSFDIIDEPNPTHYAATSVDRLTPCAPAFAAMRYAGGGEAAVAYDGSDYKSFVMGFPYECISDAAVRRSIMKGILAFLVRR